MSPAKLRGKSADEVREILKGCERDELLGLLTQLVALEPLYRPAEIAALSRRGRREVLRDISAGKMGDYYAFGANSIGVPASGVKAWRERFRVPGKAEAK